MKKFYLKNLDCANCAEKILDALNELQSTKSATLNFPVNVLTIESDNIKEALQKIVELEPKVEITEELGEEKISHYKIFCILTSFFVALAFLFFDFKILGYIFLALAYFVAIKNILLSAIGNIKARIFFDENVLMLSSSIAAFFLDAYIEATAIIVFYALGEHLQNFAVFKSKDSLKILTRVLSKNIEVLDSQNKIIKKEVSVVSVGEIIVVGAGSQIPLDGVIVEGEGYIDTQAINGESVPVLCRVGDEVLSGSFVLETSLKIRVTHTHDKSFMTKMQDLLENAITQKTRAQHFITRFSQYYTPMVFIFAIAVCLIPYLLGYGEFKEWFYRALVVLMVSCPCALVLAIPLGYFIAIGRASKEGILIKDARIFEKILRIQMVIFDKTGTLTTGQLSIQEIKPQPTIKQEELLDLANVAMQRSTHLIAKSFAPPKKNFEIKSYKEVLGRGVVVCGENEEILAGNALLMQENNVFCEEVDRVGLVVHIAKNKKYQGYILLHDSLRDEAQEVVKNLKDLSQEVVVISGDNAKNVESITKTLSCKTFSQTLPQDKYEIIKEYQKEKRVLFVGDGLNDAPAIGVADVGVSMGVGGNDINKQNADILLLRDDLMGVVKIFLITKKMRKILWQNIGMIFGIKILLILCGIFGMAEIWEAIFGDVGVSLLALLNAWRIFRI
ncbi:heavy metal translocating P-type ATPase [Helicobacter anatolicus]|nr:heavy metal translocating P-type ATPase [Helicobacter anatolicus]MCE3039301.1 cadmium-translocating P-type ATPase [Helicobacter anatolicus]